MQDAWGSFFPVPFRRLSGSVRFSAPLPGWLDAPYGAGRSSETGCRYGVACPLDCGSAQGLLQPLFYSLRSASI